MALASSYSTAPASSFASSGEDFGREDIHKHIVIYGTLGLGPSIEGGLATIIDHNDFSRLDVDTAGQVIYNKVITAGGDSNNPIINGLYGLHMNKNTTIGSDSSQIIFERSRNNSSLNSGDNIGTIHFHFHFLLIMY